MYEACDSMPISAIISVYKLCCVAVHENVVECILARSTTY